MIQTLSSAIFKLQMLSSAISKVQTLSSAISRDRRYHLTLLDSNFYHRPFSDGVKWPTFINPSRDLKEETCGRGIILLRHIWSQNYQGVKVQFRNDFVLFSTREALDQNRSFYSGCFIPDLSQANRMRRSVATASGLGEIITDLLYSILAWAIWEIPSGGFISLCSVACIHGLHVESRVTVTCSEADEHWPVFCKSKE